MAYKSLIWATVLALGHSVLSKPVKLLGTEHMTVTEISNLTWTVDRHMLVAFECLGQSCLIADTAGSTGRDPILKAEGAGEADIQCIIKHNPAVGDLLKNYNGKPPEVPKQDTGVVSSLMGGLNGAWRPLVAATGSTETGKFTGTY